MSNTMAMTFSGQRITTNPQSDGASSVSFLMPFTVGPIRDLAKALTECADALEKGDAGQTKLQVEHLKRVAELLAIDPDFQRVYRESAHRCDGPDPRAALDCMTA